MNGAGLVLRLLAIALAGVLATATSEPIEVADALIQQLRVSPRFAIGVLAALRLLPLLAQEWQTLGLARRARGRRGGAIAARRRAPVRRQAPRRCSSGSFGAGARMALAMEARGFGALPCRSVARPQRMRASDWAWIAGALLLASAAIGISLALGTWRPLLG